jgi:hypothetical protein
MFVILGVSKKTDKLKRLLDRSAGNGTATFSLLVQCYEVHSELDLITRNVGQDGGYDKKLRNKMASDNARISIGV